MILPEPITSGKLSLSGNITASAGSFNIGDGTLSIDNRELMISTTWLGQSLTLRCSVPLGFSGSFDQDFILTDMFTLPPVTKSATAIDPTGLVSAITKPFTEAARTVGVAVTVTVSVNISDKAFSAIAACTVWVAGKPTGIEVSLSSDTGSIADICNKIVAEIEKQVTSIWADEIKAMGKRAYDEAKSLAEEAMKRAIEEAKKLAEEAAKLLEDAKQNLESGLKELQDTATDTIKPVSDPVLDQIRSSGLSTGLSSNLSGGLISNIGNAYNDVKSSLPIGGMQQGGN